MLSGYDLYLLHTEYGHLVGRYVEAFIRKNAIYPELIAWHGHTIFHDPDKYATMQLGDPAAIAARTGRDVVANFRNIDVALKGQGAPLAPLADQWLLEPADFYLNLGGISNISFKTSKELISYDVSPCNQLLNELAHELDLAYDDAGSIASGGQINVELLRRLDALPYYQAPYPKSIDNNWIRKDVIPILQSIDDSTQNKLHTCTRHIADQIGHEINRHAGGPSTTLATGGGAFNTYLVALIQERIEASGSLVKIPDDRTIEFKEAALMALMGFMFSKNLVNVYSSVTGSDRDHTGGCLYRGWKNNPTHE